eukprot:3749946-Rhodomonas_salina.1
MDLRQLHCSCDLREREALAVSVGRAELVVRLAPSTATTGEWIHPLSNDLVLQRCFDVVDEIRHGGVGVGDQIDHLPEALSYLVDVHVCAGLQGLHKLACEVDADDITERLEVMLDCHVGIDSLVLEHQVPDPFRVEMLSNLDVLHER